MRKKRVSVLVEWDLDLIPGFNDDVQDMADAIQYYLDTSISHYNPQVMITGETKLVERNYNPRTYGWYEWRKARDTVNRLIRQGVHAEMHPDGPGWKVFHHPVEEVEP